MPEDSKDQANKGVLTRKSAEDTDVIEKVCHGLKLTPEWRNQLRLSSLVMSINASDPLIDQQFDQMIMNHYEPSYTFEGLGDTIKVIPNVYAKGHNALEHSQLKCNL